MCIAIYKPADKTFSKEALKICWDANPDGAGYMYVHNGSLRVKKGFMTFEKFFASFNNNQHKNVVLHFRIKTHGKANQENTHPFFVDKTLGFVHNGIISKVETKSNKDMSDTWHFNEHILKPLFQLNPNFIDSEAVQELIMEYIGFSKLIFMDDKEQVWILNEEGGEWANGIWYSNNSYLKKVTKVYPSPVYSKEYYKPHYTVTKPADMQNMTKLEVNTFVTLRENYLELKKGCFGIVDTFYQDHTCGVLFSLDVAPYTPQFKRIPIYLLDISDENDFQMHQLYS